MDHNLMVFLGSAMISLLDVGVLLVFGVYFDHFFAGYTDHNFLTMTIVILVCFMVALLGRLHCWILTMTAFLKSVSHTFGLKRAGLFPRRCSGSAGRPIKTLPNADRSRLRYSRNSGIFRKQGRANLADFPIPLHHRRKKGYHVPCNHSVLT